MRRNGSLAVISSQVGAASETFIRRHMEYLWPGRTVCVVGSVAIGAAATWESRNPLFCLQHHSRASVLRRVGRRLCLESSPLWEAPLGRFLRRHGVGCVLGEYLDFSLQFRNLIRRLGLPFWVHAHGWDVSARLREPDICAAYRTTYAEAAGVITISVLSRDRLIKLGLPQEKVHVVPYGVDVPEQAPVRLERRGVRCLAVGRMVPKKAPVLLLDAFRRALERDARLRLDYVGAGVLLPAAEQFVRAFGLAETIRLHGQQPAESVTRLMKEADVFVQHSIVDPATGDEEGLPVAILEAMAAGLPVVATRHAGIPEAVEEGVTGLLVEEGDTMGMGERLARLAGDPAKRRAMGQAGWRRARAEFSWEHEKSALLSLLTIGEGG